MARTFHPSLALFALGAGALLSACGAATDEPSKDEIATAMQAAFDSYFPAHLGRMKLTQWDKLTYDCTQQPGDVKRVACITGGKVSVVGYQNGVEVQGGGAEADSPIDLTLEKREEGWVLADYAEKAR